MKKNKSESQENNPVAMLEQSAAALSLRSEKVFQIGAEYLIADDRVVIDALEFLGEHHEKSKEHSLRVFLLALDMGLELAVAPEELRVLGIAAALHDIGKSRIDLAILAKPGKLTPEEREAMKEHVAAGVAMLDTIYASHADKETIKKIVGHHHGYDLKDPYFGMPKDALEEDEPDERLELLRQVLASADVFDALSSARDYRDPLPKEKIENILHAELGVDEARIAQVLERFLHPASRK